MAKQDERYNINIAMVVTNETGDEIMDTNTTFRALHYAQLPPIEDCYVAMLSKLVDLGYGEAAERAPDQAPGLAAAKADIRG